MSSAVSRFYKSRGLRATAEFLPDNQRRERAIFGPHLFTRGSEPKLSMLIRDFFAERAGQEWRDRDIDAMAARQDVK